MKDSKLIETGKWYTEFDENGNCTSTVYDASYRMILGFETEEEYTYAQKTWKNEIHPDDEKRFKAHLRECLEKHPEGMDFDIEYRKMTKDGYRWFHDYAHCTRRKDGSVIRFDGVIFDIQKIKEKENQLAHEKLRTEILNYMVKNDDDPIELLKANAERIRSILGCDQIVYRDLEETRIMVNSSAIAKTWSVPVEYCMQCQHFDSHHPMYKDGYTEMDNCQKGWKGIPVYKDCPIKSSLTRIVYCDDKTAGYLAVHYVKEYHHFTDLERETLEIFTRILSLSLSRYEAKKREGELNSVKKTLSMTFALSDQFDPIIVLDPETGEYDWLMSVAEDVVNNTSMTLHGNDIYKNIGIDGASIIHEEDRAQFQAFYNKENMMKIVTTGETQEIENRWFIHTENRYRWKYNKAVRMTDDCGRYYVVIGVMDTTEAKEDEEKFKAQKKLFEEQQAISENAARFFALEDSFEALYDVEIESGLYISYVKGDFYQINVTDKLITPVNYFEDLKENISTVIYEDDREGLSNVLTKEALFKELPGNDHFDYFYRIKTDNGPVWLKLRIVYKNPEKKNIIIGVFNASEDVAAKQIAEQKESLLEAKRRNELLHNAVKASIWSYDINENDEVVGAYYDSYAEEKSGIKDLNSPMNWVNALHFEDKDRVLGEFMASIHDHSGNTPYETTYRMMTSDGNYMWIKSSGRLNFHEDGTSELLGISVDLTDQINEQNRRAIEAEESRKLIDSITSSYNTAYAVNLDTDKVKLLRSDDTVIGAGRKFASFREVKDFFISMIPESDRETMSSELDSDTIRKKLKDTRSYEVEYRLYINNAVFWHVMNVTLIEENYIALGFAHRDIEITQKHLERKRYSEYFALYEIDIDTGTMKIIKDSPFYGLDRIGKVMSYKPAMLKFSENLDDEPRAFFEKMADLDYVKKEYAVEDKRTYTYRSNYIREKEWVECTIYITLRHKDGTPSMITLVFSLLDSLGVYRQELQNKYVEQNKVLVLQQEQLVKARAAADAANKAKTTFLFNMSHDIRTPMNAIRGFTAMAKKNAGNEKKVVDYLEKIDISGQQLLTLVNQVLEMARIESGKMEFESKPVNIREEFNSLVTVLAEQACVKGLDFKYFLGYVEHDSVLADEARMSSVVLNISGNAMKYTPEGGRIEFSLNEIQSRKKGYATFVFTVSDTGIGMSEKYLKELYEPFSRERSSTVSKIQGTGLGLSIVKSIIDLMGGNIDVQSEPGKGTRFDITADLKIDVNAERVLLKEDIVEKVSFKGRRILLAEDNAFNREIARDFLEERGFIVEDAVDGSEAVAMVQAVVSRGEFHYYDLILMDVQMPKMNGYEATKAIRSIPGPGGVHIPIVAMTANAFEEDRQNAIAAGMDDHLAKPMDVQKLFRTIGKFIK